MVLGSQQELNKQFSELHILNSRGFPPGSGMCMDGSLGVRLLDSMRTRELPCSALPISQPTPGLMSSWNHPFLAPGHIHTPVGTLFQASPSAGAEKTKRALQQLCHPTGMTPGTSIRLRCEKSQVPCPTQQQSFLQKQPTPLTREINGLFSPPISK